MTMQTAVTEALKSIVNCGDKKLMATMHISFRIRSPKPLQSGPECTLGDLGLLILKEM